MNKYIYFGIILTFIGILLTTFFITPLSTYAGISLIFIGTILSTIIGIRSNKKENEKTLIEVKDKLAEFKSEIKSVKETSLSKNVKEVVKKTEDKFNSWANKFVQKKDQLVIRQKKKMLSIEEEQLKQTAFWREYILHFNHTLTNFINAINKESKLNIVFSEFSIPKNLFKWDKANNIAEVKFREDLFWLINYKIDLERKTLVITIEVRDSSILRAEEGMREYMYGWGILNIKYDKQGERINVSTESPKFDAKELKEEYKLEDYQSSINKIIEKIFESQLLEL